MLVGQPRLVEDTKTSYEALVADTPSETRPARANTYIAAPNTRLRIYRMNSLPKSADLGSL